MWYLACGSGSGGQNNGQWSRCCCPSLSLSCMREEGNLTWERQISLGEYHMSAEIGRDPEEDIAKIQASNDVRPKNAPSRKP